MADPTDPLSYINPFSRCVVHLTMDFEGIELATGTGFLRRRGGELFLITAWHNLTGREPATLKPKHSQGSLPNYVRIEGYFFARRLALYFDNNPNDEEHCSRCFWQHPHGPDIDVAVLRVPSSSQEEGWPIDETFFDPSKNGQMQLWVTQPCIVVGFPHGLVDLSQPHHVLPIYKGAQIASEPYIEFQGRPVVVIDSTTRPGMSGSPVFVQDLTYNGQYKAGRFLGIYAGRFRDNSTRSEDTALGLVFRPRIITEIFDRIAPFRVQHEKGLRPQ
jgi:hypothetical protein